MYFKLCWTSIGWCRCGIPAKVSLNAFHVDVGEKAASAGSSSIRAALAGVGPRNGGSSPETHGFFPQKKWFSCEFSLNQLETHGSLDGFFGEILSGNPGFFTIKLLGGSCRFSHWSNEWMDFWGCSMLWHSKHDLFFNYYLLLVTSGICQAWRCWGCATTTVQNTWRSRQISPRTGWFLGDKATLFPGKIQPGISMISQEKWKNEWWNEWDSDNLFQRS
jgi:hypothetical protein